MSMNKRIAGELVRVASVLLGFEFPNEDALKEYLKVHPKADKRKHWVNKTDVETVKSDVPSSQTRVVPGSEDVFWNNKSDTVLGTMRSKPKTSKEDGGNHVNIVVFETYKDGSKGVFKPDTMDPDTLIDIRDNLDENVSQGKREVVSYKLDQVLGFNIVPPPYLTTACNRSHALTSSSLLNPASTKALSKSSRLTPARWSTKSLSNSGLLSKVPSLSLNLTASLSPPTMVHGIDLNFFMSLGNVNPLSMA